MAQADRLYGQRLSLYNEVATALERWRIQADRTHPIIGPQPPPPAPPPEDEWLALFGRLRVGASAQVIAGVWEATKRGAGFYGAVMAFEATRDQGGQTLEARMAMDDTRERLREAVDAAETAMRDELASL